MSDTTEYVLVKAFDLIEAEQLAEAQQLLKPLIETDRNNADVWWLYAHAVTDPETAHIALQNVLRIDKDYPEAQALLETLEANLPVNTLASASHNREPFKTPSLPTTLPGLPVPEDEDDEDESRSWRGILIPAAIMGVVLVIVIFLLLQNPGDNSNVVTTPTADQSVNTAAPVQVAGDYADIYTSLASFTMPEQAISIEPTVFGNTLIVVICESDRRQARQTLPLVLDTLAIQAESLGADVNAIAGRIQNCSTGEAWLSIGVPRLIAVDYANGSMETPDFQAAWKPIE